MSFLHIGRPHMKVRKYGVTGTGTKTIVKIDIEVTDPTELGFFLRELEEVKRSSEKAGAVRKPASGQRGARAIKQEKLLALPYFGSDEA